MDWVFEMPDMGGLLPDDGELAQAAGEGVSNAVRRHLAARDARSAPKPGMPRSGYWGDAASRVWTEVSGSSATVRIPKVGVRLHYYGGVVLPVEAKALAIPKRADAAGRRPAELDPARSKFALVWPKGSNTGYLRDRKTNETVYLLVHKATIKRDETVLPSDSELESAAVSAMEGLL